MTQWKFSGYTRDKKRAKITGPLELSIDTDDAEEGETDILIRQVVTILQRHWSSEPSLRLEIWRKALRTLHKETEERDLEVEPSDRAFVVETKTIDRCTPQMTLLEAVDFFCDDAAMCWAKIVHKPSLTELYEGFKGV